MKTKHIIAATLGLTILSSAAMANFAVYDDSSHFYTGAGIQMYHFGTPDLDIGSQSKNSKKALTSVDTSGTTYLPYLTVGYHYNNRLLPSFFGSKANIELTGGFASYSTSTNKADLGSGFYHLINGGSDPALGENEDMKNFHANTDTKYQYLNLMFRGDRESQSEMITQHPEVGLVYDHLTQDSDYGMLWTFHNNNINNEVTENIDENYVGMAFGDQVKFQLSRHFFTNVGAQLQLLHASANLDGSQSVVNHDDSDNSRGAKASDTLSSFTYRGILSAGMSYAFTLKPDSPSVGLNIGYDRLGFTPTVVNPTGSSAKAAHLKAVGSNNLFAGLNFHLPL